METNPGIHCTFIDEFHIEHEDYAKHLAAMYTQMLNLKEKEEDLMIIKMGRETSPNMQWWPLPDDYIPGKFQSVGSFTQAPYPVGDITPSPLSQAQISPHELQENWLAQVVADLQYCDSRELYLDLLRTKLMTLPGYKYASPT